MLDTLANVMLDFWCDIMVEKARHWDQASSTVRIITTVVPGSCLQYELVLSTPVHVCGSSTRHIACMLRPTANVDEGVLRKSVPAYRYQPILDTAGRGTQYLNTGRLLLRGRIDKIDVRFALRLLSFATVYYGSSDLGHDSL